MTEVVLAINYQPEVDMPDCVLIVVMILQFIGGLLTINWYLFYFFSGAKNEEISTDDFFGS